MTFIEWVQDRLRKHGAKIDVDGDWGRKSQAALFSFQRRMGLDPTGTTDRATVAALQKPKPGSDAGYMPTPKPLERMPPWMEEMHRKSGLHEVRNNSALSKWLRIGRYLGNPANLPWCGDAVESCIVKTLPHEAVPSNPFWAQSWRNFGQDVGQPIVGSIGVIRWSARAGHVGIVAGYDAARRRVHLLGGNQSNEINVTSFPRSKFIAFRWPSTYAVKQYPALKGSAVGAGSLNATR